MSIVVPASDAAAVTARGSTPLPHLLVASAPRSPQRQRRIRGGATPRRERQSRADHAAHGADAAPGGRLRAAPPRARPGAGATAAPRAGPPPPPPPRGAGARCRRGGRKRRRGCHPPPPRAGGRPRRAGRASADTAAAGPARPRRGARRRQTGCAGGRARRADSVGRTGGRRGPNGVRRAAGDGGAAPKTSTTRTEDPLAADEKRGSRQQICCPDVARQPWRAPPPHSSCQPAAARRATRPDPGAVVLKPCPPAKRWMGRFHVATACGRRCCGPQRSIKCWPLTQILVP